MSKYICKVQYVTYETLHLEAEDVHKAKEKATELYSQKGIFLSDYMDSHIESIYPDVDKEKL